MKAKQFFKLKSWQSILFLILLLFYPVYSFLYGDCLLEIYNYDTDFRYSSDCPQFLSKLYFETNIFDFFAVLSFLSLIWFIVSIIFYFKAKIKFI